MGLWAPRLRCGSLNRDFPRPNARTLLPPSQPLSSLLRVLRGTLVTDGAHDGRLDHDLFVGNCCGHIGPRYRHVRRGPIVQSIGSHCRGSAAGTASTGPCPLPPRGSNPEDHVSRRTLGQCCRRPSGGRARRRHRLSGNELAECRQRHCRLSGLGGQTRPERIDQLPHSRAVGRPPASIARPLRPVQ